MAEEAPEEQAPKPLSLGLDRLPLESVRLIGLFVTMNSDETGRLWAIYREQLHGMAEQHLDTPPAEIKRLATNYTDVDKWIGFEILAHLTPLEPDTAYPLWRELISDEKREVRFEAEKALERHLGVLAFAPERVVELLEADPDIVP